MTPAEVTAKLRVFNDWRRGELDDLSMPDAHEISEAIDAAVEMIERFEAAEKEIRRLKQTIEAQQLAYREMVKEYQAAANKIDAMEKQEPLAWTTKLALELGSSALGFDACRGNLWGEKGVPLYALPGAQAQPAPSVPDDILRDAARYRFLRAAKSIPISSKAARDPVVYDEAIDAAMLAAAPQQEGE